MTQIILRLMVLLLYILPYVHQASCYKPDELKSDQMFQPFDISNTSNHLPAPTGGHLKTIIVGIGRQNYLCPNSSVAPVFTGAEARLLAANFIIDSDKTSLHIFPHILAHHPYLASSMLHIGDHYFSNGAPVFHFRIPSIKLFKGTPREQVPAPPYTDPGAGSDTFGAVPWLRLEGSSGCAYREAYRLMTIGGMPPLTCQGRSKVFCVGYAAEYWFYG
ncbi:hypothetical protein TWF481_002666 [Arthrobotrys musiformis]|uniref:Uncharacterized protein n=1 Tax=Arthrobotrys musiformis TaxID=47236 RepID=A0AAV9VSL1_9PEZI